MVGGATSKAAAPPGSRLPRATPDRAWHHHPRASRTGSRPHAPTQGAVAVVGRPRHPRPGPGLARVHPPVRPGTLRPLRQTDPRVDHPAPAHARAGRPLDLAGAGRLHPAAPGPRDRRRPAAAVGAAPTPAAAVTGPGAARVSAAAVRSGLASEDAETLRA